MIIQRSDDPILFLSKNEKKMVIEAIQSAEMKTSGEIRLHLERKIQGDPLDHAKEIFERIGMTKTEAHNGVLILIGVKNHRLMILGDKGINEQVSEDFWDEIVAPMMEHFKEDRFAEGLTEGIEKIGQRLQELFPYQRDDISELPDEISYSL